MDTNEDRENKRDFLLASQFIRVCFPFSLFGPSQAAIPYFTLLFSP